MFEAKFPSKCSACWNDIVPGQRIEANGTYVKADKIVKGYRHADCDAPFAGAVDEDYRERWATPSQRARRRGLAPFGTPRVVSEDEADREYEFMCDVQYQLHLVEKHDFMGHPDGAVARCIPCGMGKVGLVFSKIDGGWIHPDIRDGNDFGRYEAAQEAAIYLNDGTHFSGTPQAYIESENFGKI